MKFILSLLLSLVFLVGLHAQNPTFSNYEKTYSYRPTNGLKPMDAPGGWIPVGDLRDGRLPEYYLEPTGDLRKGVTPGYYLGFKSMVDELRIFNRPPSEQRQNSFFNSLYLDFRYSNQVFNTGFYEPGALVIFDTNSSPENYDPDGYLPGNVEHDMYGITLGFSLGANPNLDVKIPLAASRFAVDGLKDTGFTGGIELFPNYRINDYVAWGVNLAYINSVSDFPIFDESMTSVSFEAMAESHPAYGINWSGRLSIGHYYPSNDDSFWLYKGNLALHFQLHPSFTFSPFIGVNLSPDELVVSDGLWMNYGIEFAFLPLDFFNFSLGMAGVGGHDVIDNSLEFYLSTKVNF